ncbi:PAS domain-containing protein [Sporosarcina sp. A2]|uniref:PAS domain-containing protein n=1 Tax=Sporosarcina sp. A2 TaxID=3393449 RepID=UPI003D7B7CDB
MLDGSRVAALVTDPSQPDSPIIYANKTFETMTGYTISETLGKNCRFSQGKDTVPRSIKEIRDAIHNQQPITKILKNYRKDGSLFWNRLHIEPLQIEDRLFFIGTQTNVSVEYRQRENFLIKRMKSNNTCSLL